MKSYRLSIICVLTACLVIPSVSAQALAKETHSVDNKPVALTSKSTLTFVARSDADVL